MKPEMCKKCIHTNVCFHDKNVCGGVFVAGNPMIFDNNELYRKYEEWEKQGFPCNDYFPEIVRCKDCKHHHKTLTDHDTGMNVYSVSHCDYMYGKVDEDGYCYLGEKVTE